jgi:hypothetical protein
MDAGGCWVYPASGIPVGRRGRYTGVDLNKKATPTAASMVATFERGKDYIYNGRNYRLYDGGICAIQLVLHKVTASKNRQNGNLKR